MSFPRITDLCSVDQCTRPPYALWRARVSDPRSLPTQTWVEFTYCKGHDQWAQSLTGYAASRDGRL